MQSEYVNIKSRDYWVKVVEFLQHNWALIDKTPENTFKIFFFGDTAGVFDELEFTSLAEATEALSRNGFDLYKEESKKFQNFIVRPEPPFYKQPHPNGEIYSSGRYWK